MPYVRIPTGMEQVTITASRKAQIRYQCCYCGESVQSEYRIEREEHGSYHAFQTQKFKNRVQNKASAKASYQLEQQDDALFEAINNRHDYSLISKEVKCPHCGKRQPWSKIPCMWRDTALYALWVVGLIFLSALSIGLFLSYAEVGVVFAIPCAVLVILPIVRMIRRKSALQKIKNTSFVPPVYQNRKSLLAEADPLMPNSGLNGVNAGGRVCLTCGVSVSETDTVCSNCGSTKLYKVPPRHQSKKTGLIVVLSLFLLIGIPMLISGIDAMNETIEIEDVADLSYKEIEVGEEYYIDKLLVVDEFGYLKEESGKAVNTRYILVGFLDQDDVFCCAPLVLQGGDEIHDQLLDYLQDDDQGIGDLIISGCFRGKSKVQGSKFESAYEKACDSFEEKAFDSFGEYIKIVPTEVLLEYKESDPETLIEQKENDNRAMVAASAVAVLMAVAFLIFLIQNRIRQKRKRSAVSA